MNKKIQKIVAGALVLVLGFALTACAAKKDFREEPVTMAELNEKIEKKESFKLLVERDNCPFCQELNDYVDETKKDHDGTVYVLDVTDFDFKREKEDDLTLVSENEDGKQFLALFPYFLYTPTIYTIEKGVVQQAAIGYDPQNQTMSLWDVDSSIDWDSAETTGVWDYLES